MPSYRVLITGCATGVGRATAELLAEKGYDVFATMRDTSRGYDLVEGATAKGWKLLAVHLDVCDDESVAAAMGDVGRVDILVNVAGIQDIGPMEEMSIADLKRHFETNTVGPFRLMKAALPGMRERRFGVIVNVSSYHGRFASPMSAVYSSSKHALEAISEALRYEVGQFGIRVHVIEPGYIVDTALFKKGSLVGARGGDESSPYADLDRLLQENRGNLIPLPRTTTPRLVAGVILQAIERGDQFRYPVGPDAESILALRNSTDDVDFDLLRRKELNLGW